jgi:hypothetical protein
MRSDSARHREHPTVDVEANDASGRPNAVRKETRDGTGTTGDVK